MKVLHLYKTYTPDTFGGVEKFIDQLILSTQALGVDSEVLALTRTKHPQTLDINGYKVHRVHQNLEIASCPFSFAAISRFKELAEHADIIHYHFPWPYADMLHYLAGIKKPCLVTYHSDVVKQKILLQLYTPLMKKFLTAVDMIVATSPNYVNTSQVLRNFPQKTKIIPIGIDKKNYPDPSPEIMAQWQAKFNGPFFLFIGNLRYYKGVQFLIEAAKSVEAPIVIVGSVKTAGPEFAEKMKQFDKTNLHFLDEISEEDKIALLKLCYALVLPSHLRSEAFGIALLEGAMFAKPLISCEIGTGTTYVNIGNETGLVVPPRDSKSLSEAMQSLLANPSTARAMGQQAEYRFNTLFTADKMAQAYMELYRDLL